jgi:hypothetical protein
VLDETSDETCVKTCDDGVSETPWRTQPVKTVVNGWMDGGRSVGPFTVIVVLPWLHRHE